MLLIKFIFIFFIFFFKIIDANSFDISTNLQLGDSYNFKSLNKINNDKFIDFINKKDLKEKHFIISYSKINPNLESYLKFDTSNTYTKFRFVKIFMHWM